MKKSVVFGEIMLRLNPEGYLRFVQADKYLASFAGGESNVAISLANYGIDSYCITKLPDNEIGQSCLNSLRRYGVKTDCILRGGDRIGVLYLEKGASQRASKVIYDRKHSAFADADPSEYNWKEIFKDAEWFHFTGITPALSANAALACVDACKIAREMSVTVSCDLNFRKNLWSKEAACETMTKLMPYVNVCIANEEDASDIFGIQAANSDITAGNLSYDGYESVAKELVNRFGFQKVAITLRKSKSANDNDWAGMLFDGEECVFSKNYPIHIVDRVGGGDSFGGGLIYSLMSGKSAKDAIEFAVAASCLKHTIEYDYNLTSIAEVEKLVNGDGSGRVQR